MLPGRHAVPLSLGLLLAATACGAPPSTSMPGALDGGAADACCDADPTDAPPADDVAIPPDDVPTPNDVADTSGPADAAPDVAQDVPPADPEACNLHRALCDRAYNDVAYATTHNAFSNEEDGWIAPNQRVPMPRQLAQGVRGLMLDFHYDEGVAHLCHGTCLAGKKPLVDGLAEITTFLNAHPREVVTLILEVYVEPEDVRAAFEASGLLEMVYVRDPAVGWPTLRTMIEANTRVVVFTDDAGGTFPWYHDVWDYNVETHFSVAAPEDFTCLPNRGRRGADLLILNHFISDPFPRPRYAEVVNLNPFLIGRARTCAEELDHLPNFVTVDFQTIGDVLEAVGLLNGVE